MSEERSILKYSTERTRLVRGGEFEYKLFWIGEETNRGGVGIMVKRIDEASDTGEKSIFQDYAETGCE